VDQPSIYTLAVFGPLACGSRSLPMLAGAEAGWWDLGVPFGVPTAVLLPNTIEQGAPAQADLLDVTEGSPKISPVAGRSLIIYNTPRISIYFIS
jgi:hypothetical protein